MHVTFLETRRVSEDGFVVKCCHQGVTYDLMGDTARFAINKGWARKSTPEEVENCKAAKASEQEVLAAVSDRLASAFGRPFAQNPLTHADKGEPL